MPLSPLGLHSNLYSLGLNPAFSVAPRLAIRCLPCLTVLPLLPMLDSTDALPLVWLVLVLPQVNLNSTMVSLGSYNGLSTVEVNSVLPSLDTSSCPC